MAGHRSPSADAFKSKRCLIPADGFYEWTISPADKGRDPWHIFLPDHQPCSFAGIWAHNDKLGVTSCCIITMPAGDPMLQLHDRQPVILDPDVYDAWLDPETPPADAKQLMHENQRRSGVLPRRPRGQHLGQRQAALRPPSMIEPITLPR